MKTCFKCDRELPLSEFYRHPQMADGHLGKCKECTKRDTTDWVKEKQKDPDWVVAEAERHRKKQEEYRQTGRAVILSKETRAAVLKRHAEKYPEKTKARTALGNAVRDGVIKRRPCEVCGVSDSEAHHDDYSKPLEVIWLCPKHHAERHVKLNDARRIERAKKRQDSQLACAGS